jgi:hypothetical protein
MRTFLFISLAAQITQSSLAFSVPSQNKVSTCLNNAKSSNVGEIDDVVGPSRRNFLSLIIPAAIATSQLDLLSSGPQPAFATMTGAGDGNLPELPFEAVRSYLQYRVALQIAADYYVFELQNLLADADNWGDVSQLFRVNNNKGQGQPSRMERDYVNPMRVLLLSMPPDEIDDMRDAQFKFERAMASISKATAGYSKDLPVEIPKSAVVAAEQGWEDGRVALNEFFALLNNVTGLKEMKAIPAAGPNQRDEYGRSKKRYSELVKKTKLCQNRGGPALSQAWGGLMVSGYLQDSCGIPDLDAYFYQ